MGAYFPTGAENTMKTIQLEDQKMSAGSRELVSVEVVLDTIQCSLVQYFRLHFGGMSRFDCEQNKPEAKRAGEDAEECLLISQARGVRFFWSRGA